MIILDTHTLVWWITAPSKLSNKARTTIDKSVREEEQILVSSICVWEIFLLVKSGELKFSIDINDWLERVEALPFLRFIPIDNNIAARSVMLPGKFHKDPADRLIVATAREYGAVLVTSDQKIKSHRQVKTLW